LIKVYDLYFDMFNNISL